MKAAKLNRLAAALLALVILSGVFGTAVYATPDDASFEKLRVYSLDDALGFSSLPVLNIDMENGEPIERRDKELVQSASLTVYGQGAPVSGISLTLHGRGNSSWSSVGTGKKSYTLKLDSAENLLKLGSAKSWCLISNWVDTTYMRNYIAYKCAGRIGCSAPDCALCDLCINGEYEGIYLLCEANNLNKNRVITKGDGEDINGDGIVEQYLLEARCDWKETGFWADRAEIYFRVKDTGSGEDPDEGQLVYLADFINRLNKSIMEGRGYEEMMDVDSFIECYLINELFKNPDYGFGYQHYYSSTFCYMEEGGKLYFGPLWDFDISMGRNCFDNIPEEENRPTMHPDGILTGETKWVADLMKQPEFAARVSKRWFEISPVLRRYIPRLMEETDELLLPSVRYDCDTWGGIEGRCTWWNYRTPKGYAQEVKYIADWSDRRFDWLDEYFEQFRAEEEKGLFEKMGGFFSSLLDRLFDRGQRS